MNWNVLGLVASLNNNAGLYPETYVCSDPLNSDSTMCTNYGGDQGSVPVVTTVPPASLNPAPPALSPVIASDPAPVQQSPAAANLLPVSNPGAIMSLPDSVPTSPTPTTVTHIATANPWLLGLLAAGGIYLIAKKKKGK